MTRTIKTSEGDFEVLTVKGYAYCLRYFMKSKGMTIRQFANWIGSSYNTISMVVSGGNTYIKPYTLDIISKRLQGRHIDVHYLKCIQTRENVL